MAKAEQEALAERNGMHEKPLKAELEVRDVLDMAKRPNSSLAYRMVTISEFKQAHDVLKGYSVQQISQALNKIGIEDLGRQYVNGKQQRVRSLPVWKMVNYGELGTA